MLSKESRQQKYNQVPQESHIYERSHRNFSVMIVERRDMEEGFSKYDPTEYLTSEAEIKAYLDEAAEVGD